MNTELNTSAAPPRRGRGRPRKERPSAAAHIAELERTDFRSHVPAPKEFLRVKDLVALYGISRMTIHRMLKLETLPLPRRLGRNLIWLRTEIEQWAHSLPVGRGETPVAALTANVSIPTRSARKETVSAAR